MAIVVLVILALASALYFPPYAIAETAEEKKIISAFEQRVDLFEKFFAALPHFLEKQAYKSTPVPGGYILFWCRFDRTAISYDVRRTDSLISPYMAHVKVDYVEKRSHKCGDFSAPYSAGRYFTTLENARKSREDDSCYGEDIFGESKFVFAFQKGKWVFKEVLNTKNNSIDNRLTTIKGIPSGSWFPVEENNPWKVLIAN
jgi:hypothetical protein